MEQVTTVRTLDTGLLLTNNVLICKGEQIMTLITLSVNTPNEIADALRDILEDLEAYQYDNVSGTTKQGCRFDLDTFPEEEYSPCVEWVTFNPGGYTFKKTTTR